MGAEAARRALDGAGLSAEDVGMIVVSTSTPDYFFPSVSCRIQRELGAFSAFCFDLSAACTGSIYALDIASRYLETGGVRHCLVIATETLSTVTDYADRTTCVLFGDAAGAVVLSRGESLGVLSSFLATDARGWESLYARIPEKTVMDGKEVYKFAVGAMPEAINRVLADAGKSMEDVRWIVPHQANIRIIESVVDKYHLPPGKVKITIGRYGNTSSSTIFVALDELNRAGELGKGDLVLMVGFGAGLTYGAILVEWM